MERTRTDPFNPVSKGLPVTGTPRQRELLSLFTRYECLPTSYILKAMGAPESTQDLITLLNTEGYIRVAPASTRRLDARNKEATWEGTEKGERLLGKDFLTSGDQFAHKIRRVVVRFSFDQAAKEIPGLTDRTLQDVLDDERCPSATRKVTNPNSFEIDGHTIVPDEPLRGFQFNNRFFYLHGLEVNGGTETYTPRKHTAKKKKNITKMIKAYGAYLERDLCFTRYGLKNVFIPIIAVDRTDAEAIKTVIRREIDPELQGKFGLKVVPDFTEGFPPPTAHMVTEDWETTTDPVNILEILKGR